MPASGFVQTAAETGGGTQDFRAAGMSATPNVAMFFVTSCTGVGTPVDEAQLSFGFCTGEGQFCSTIYEQDNVASTVTWRRTSDSSVIVLLDSAGDIIAEAELAAFLPDNGSGAGVQLTWTTTPPSAYLITALLASVPDAATGVFDSGALENEEIEIGLAFRPSMLLFVSQAEAIPAASLPAYFSLGLAVDDLTLTQACLTFQSTDGENPPTGAARLVDNRAIGEMDATGDLLASLELTGIAADGFTMTQRLAAGSGQVAYLALALEAVDYWLEVITLPATTGVQSFSGPGFGPIGVFQILTAMPAVNTAYTDGRSGTFSLSLITGSAEASLTLTSERGGAVSNVKSLVTNKANYVLDDDGATEIVDGSFEAFDAEGWGLDYEVAAARKAIALAFGPGFFGEFFSFMPGTVHSPALDGTLKGL